MLMEPVWIVLIVIAAVLLLLPFFLVAPRIPGKKKKAPFYGRNIAHRGLYEKDQSIPENSLGAFARAVEHGYGMELDVQLSKDGEVVVFHDDSLKRVCGVDARVDSLTLSELRELRLYGTGEKIPLFREVLDLVSGREPIIVELKTGPRNRELCEKTLAMLQSYTGETCIESFNPMMVAWFRFHARKIFRGQLAQPPARYKKEKYSGFVSFLLGNMILNVLARPHFVAYRVGKKPVLVRLCEKMGAVRVGWTGKSEADEKGLDVLIFEHYLPELMLRRQHREGS